MTKYFALILFSSFIVYQQSKPELYIIGDSTVKNGNGKSSNLLQGWGSWVYVYFDTTQISIQNKAIGGRSSRTFLTEGRWNEILKTLKKGDYVLIQFGHNDAGALDDTARARGSVKGIGGDSVEIYNPIKKIKEVVHTYGWYLRKYINDAKAAGAIPVICSPVPRCNFTGAKIKNDNYASWSEVVARQTKSFFIPLNALIGAEYERLGQIETKKFFPRDNTHTNLPGLN